MRLPPESASSWTHIPFAAFTWASIKAWSEFTQLPDSDRAALAEMATSLRAAIESLVKEARETQDQLIFGRPEAQAKQNAFLTLLKRAAAEALAIVTVKIGQGSKDHPRVREFLPDLLGGITSKGIAERPGAVEEAAARLAATSDGFSDKAEIVVKLQQAALGAKAAIDANAGSWTAWRKERSEEIVSKGRLRLELEKTHRLLGARFPGQRDFVESFFLRGAKPSEGVGEDEEEAPAVEG